MARDACEYCFGTGVEVREDELGYRKAKTCRCREEQRRDALWRYGMPRKLHDVTLGDFITRTQRRQRVLKKAKQWLADWPQDSGALLAGPPGGGKTTLAVGMARELLVHHDIAPRFCLFDELLQDIRDTYNDRPKETAGEVIARAKYAPLLVLDDFGAHRMTDWARSQLMQIVSHRYDERLPTIMTTNAKIDDEGDELYRNIGAGTFSRVASLAVVLEVPR